VGRLRLRGVPRGQGHRGLGRLVTAATLHFWFEFASTYSYVAASRVEAAAREAGVPLRYEPFLLGPIFAAQGWKDSPFNLYPVKGRYMWRDMERLCAEQGIPLKRPSVFPRNHLTVARVAAAAQDEPWLPAFVASVYRANFGDDRDTTSPDVIAELLAAQGQPAERWLARASEEQTKLRLRNQTDRASALGLFGAPSFTVGDELFWGNDRLEQAIAFARAQQ
jgi:2-hydroxychromene-2-carboxylate isomerase